MYNSEDLEDTQEIDFEISNYDFDYDFDEKMEEGLLDLTDLGTEIEVIQEMEVLSELEGTEYNE